MRNISLCSRTSTTIEDAHIVATAVDPESSVIFALSVKDLDREQVLMDIWTIGMDQSEKPSIVATLASKAIGKPCPQIISFDFVIPDTRMLCVISRSGDITTLSLEDEAYTVEVQGTVEPEISAASWNPDNSLLALVTGENQLILMTSTFDVLSEKPLHTADFGEDAPINVGWGSKQTQFHGSLGKVAAQTTSLTTVRCSPDDDTRPRISWRGDGSFFVVSSLSPSNPVGPHRIFRVYDRNGILQSTSEPVPGQEHPLAWRPSGNLIASTQRFGFHGGGAGSPGRHDVVFFERNGLRHGEFGLRPAEVRVQAQSGSDGKTANMPQWGYKVREMSWSCDSSVLSIWVERDAGDVVQLWVTGNYHWYLKQEIAAPASSDGACHFTSVTWHPEADLTLILTTPNEVIQRTYAWEIYSSPSRPPHDSASVAVFDGSTVLLTPFRVQNVPPPMSSCQLSLYNDSAPVRTPIHAAFSSSRDFLAVLWEAGHVELWDLRTHLESGRGKVMDPHKVWEGTFDGNCRQIKAWPSESTDASRLDARVVVLRTTSDGLDMITFAELEGGQMARSSSIQASGYGGRLVESSDTPMWQAPDGALFKVDFADSTISSFGRFLEFCMLSNSVSAGIQGSNKAHNSCLCIGLATSGKLYLTTDPTSSHILHSHVTSFTVTSTFLIFITNSHEAVFVPLPELASVTSEVDVKAITSGWEKRKVERGSRIITAIPSTMGLVLQMPRGNLETINPRPLVMEVIKQDLDIGNYRKAFLACRKHRIDLSIIVEHNQELFLERLTSFVEQVDDVDYMNLFLTNIGRSSQSPDVISQLCDSIRAELETRDLGKYVNSILTAYVVKSPPDYEAGLTVLLRLREKNASLVEDAVKYMIFLVDADKLFDTALGMYDFSLVLMIAQHAQKDPREYLPFLRELRTLDKYYQRFKIDDHLRRHESALHSIHLAGPEHFEEAMGYVERHQLYKQALSLWAATDQCKVVLDLYGDWLFDRRAFKKAALVFIEAEKPSKAMVAHEKSLQWQELFDLAARQETPQDDIIAMGYRVAEDLSSKKRYMEGGRVLLDYAKDVREAVITLVEGNLFSEARRIVTLHAVPELLTDIVHPATLEACAQLMEDIKEMREQIRKQLQRIEELRVKKKTEPDAFYGVEDSNLHNVDVMTDVSMAATTFTRYTVAPSAMTKTSKQTSRSKRKMERKIGSGRKGTIDEEEYLLKSVTKLVGRFDAVRAEAEKVLPHLWQFTVEHREAGKSLQNDLRQFEFELGEAVGKIWAKAEHEAVLEDSWSSRMAEKEKERQVDPVLRVVKPEVTEQDWRVDLFDMGE